MLVIIPVNRCKSTYVQNCPSVSNPMDSIPRGNQRWILEWKIIWGPRLFFNVEADIHDLGSIPLKWAWGPYRKGVQALCFWLVHSELSTMALWITSFVSLTVLRSWVSNLTNMDHSPKIKYWCFVWRNVSNSAYWVALALEIHQQAFSCFTENTRWTCITWQCSWGGSYPSCLWAVIGWVYIRPHWVISASSWTYTGPWSKTKHHSLGAPDIVSYMVICELNWNTSFLLGFIFFPMIPCQMERGGGGTE